MPEKISKEGIIEQNCGRVPYAKDIFGDVNIQSHAENLLVQK